jgi:gluconate 5-dehydrogenase
MPSALFDLTGKTALITGSSQGIGYALAEGLGGAGARIILNGRDPARLEAAAGKLHGKGLHVTTAAFDVTQAKAVHEGIAAAEAANGPVHILINNAGIQKRAALVDFDKGDWDHLFATNVDSVFLVAQAVAKGMIARKSGKIINICSVQSELGRPSIGPYTASKGAVKMLTKAMCAEWARHGIQINGIGPGYFRTELTEALVNNSEFTAWLKARTPAERWGDGSELAGAAIFLSSAASSFVNGHILMVDGGMTAVV